MGAALAAALAGLVRPLQDSAGGGRYVSLRAWPRCAGAETLPSPPLLVSSPFRPVPLHSCSSPAGLQAPGSAFGRLLWGRGGDLARLVTWAPKRPSPAQTALPLASPKLLAGWGPSTTTEPLTLAGRDLNRAGSAVPPPATNLGGASGPRFFSPVQLGRIPGSTDEKYITEKYRIWMKGQEAEWAAVPLSLSPPAGARGLWEGRAEVASAKVPPQARLSASQSSGPLCTLGRAPSHPDWPSEQDYVLC